MTQPDPASLVTTRLVISPNGLPPYSTRGAKQTLEPISATGHQVRTVNGGLLDLSPPQMRKYKSEISCTDLQAPAFCALWPGDLVTVDCAVFVGRPLGTSITVERTVINSFIDGNFIFERYQLQMMVMQPWSIDYDEYNAQHGWKITLEEI